MAGDRGRPPLPRVLVAGSGHHPPSLPPMLEAGLLLRDTELETVIERATADGPPLALDIDSVRGLNADDVAIEFVVRHLGIGIVLTRRPTVAAHVAHLGGVGLVHVLAFDSTGLWRSLESHPRRDGVGTVVSPGLVLLHMDPHELAQLPRPVLAYGLIGTIAEATTCLDLADAVAIAPGIAGALGAALGPVQRPVRRPLTTVLAEE